MAAFADKATLDLRKLPLLLLLCVQLSHTFPVRGESPEEKSTRVVQVNPPSSRWWLTDVLVLRKLCGLFLLFS